MALNIIVEKEDFAKLVEEREKFQLIKTEVEAFTSCKRQNAIVGTELFDTSQLDKEFVKRIIKIVNG